LHVSSPGDPIPDLEARPWWSRDQFTDVSSLLEDEGNFAGILADYRRALQEMGNPQFDWRRNTTPSGHWAVFPLYNQGRRMAANCSICPHTVRLIDSLPGFLSGSVFGNAAFSLVQAGTRIAGHHGPCNVRVRCHLGLQVPSNCHLTVDSLARTWDEGRCLFFDDSFYHEVENALPSDTQDECDHRAILMIDLWHPGLTRVERDAISAVF